MNGEITLRIILEQPPPGVTFGIQKGKGSIYETILKQQAAAGEDLVFEFSVPVVGGPIVQGPPDARFVYLDIGTYAGQAGSQWGRRLKVPLSGITSRMRQERVLETRVPGTGRDGTPNCGTVRDFAGWSAAK